MTDFSQHTYANALAVLGLLCLGLLAVLIWGFGKLRNLRSEIDELQGFSEIQAHKLKQAQRMEAVGILAGSIVHNLNNLLAVILGHTRMALHDKTAKVNGNEDLLQVVKAGTMASEMVQEISDFYRQADQARKPTNLAPIVRDTLKFLRDILPPNVEIREDLDSSCGLVLATATGVQQVLMNLCSNSLHAMYRDQGIIAVSLCREEVSEVHRAIPHDLEPGSYVKLTVRDNGRGLSRESLNRIFDSYFSSNSGEEGIGIGLSTVTRILKDHDGVSIPQGRVGHGARFDIYFPLIAWSVVAAKAKPYSRPGFKRIHRHALPAEERPAPELTAVPLPELISRDEVAEGERGRVLLVDDEEMVAQVTAAGLRSQGFLVTMHTDARLALEIFTDAPDDFDVVVTDQIMPHMSGVRLTRKIHGIRPALPVILMTGFRDSFNERQAKDSGVKDFILKPFSHRDLSKLLDHTLLRRLEGSS